MKRILILSLAMWGSAAVLSADPARAADAVRLGSAGAQELRIPVGPRGTALSGASVADATGVEALYWNPAGVVGVEGTEFLFSSMDYLVDTDVHYVGLTQEFSGRFSLGLALKSVSIGDIPVTTEAIGGPTGETFSPTNSVIGLTIGRQVAERVAFGVTANLVNESIRNQGATGVSFDLGFQYDPAWRGVRVGAVMKNFGPKMRFGGPDFVHTVDLSDSDPSAASRSLSTESAAFELPSTFQIGVSFDAYQAEASRLLLLSAFQSNTFAADEYRLGAEYSWRDRLHLRGGTTASDQEEYTWGFTFGGGVRADLGDWGVVVDYARQSTSEFFDDQNLISFKLQF